MIIKKRLPILIVAIVCIFAIGGSGCATKKYVRQTVNERVTPLEGRTQELEETVRRNTGDIKSLDERLTKEIAGVDAKADRAQQSADAANQNALVAKNAADAAANRAEEVNTNVENLRSNLDKYTLLTTVSVRFKTNQAELDDEDKAELDRLALEAKNHQGYILEIQGFTDSRGGAARNDALSDRRAEAVKRYLAKQHEIPLFKMSIAGLGKLTEEVRTRESLAENRRVDVRLLVNNAVTPSSLKSAPN
ncbi:MAG: OmpA family protein [Acidobacteria bacterium]|nr:OmpA family protein [Acidobacteriota bacterium]